MDMTPLTSRSRTYLQRQSRNIASNISEKITSFFGVRKRLSEVQTGRSSSCSKRRRSAASDGVVVSSPISVASTPEGSPIERSNFCHSVLRFPPIVEPTPFGKLGDIPIDNVYDILARMPYDQLGLFSLTSSSWMERIREYTKSASFEKKWIRDIDSFDFVEVKKLYSSEDPFFSIGVMIARLTSTYSSFKERLPMFNNFLRTAKFYPDGCGRMICGFVSSCKGLNENDYKNLIDAVFSVFQSLKKSLDCILLAEDESYRNIESANASISMLAQEYLTRKDVKHLFLTHKTDDATSVSNRYFLSSLMLMYKSSGTVVQSRLLYLLYAPTTKTFNEEIINWNCFADLTISTEDEAITFLKPLADALRALLLSRKCKPDFNWSKTSVFNLLEEITTFPSPWSMSTFVSLLLIQPQLIPIAVATRMMRSHEEEAGDMISTMKLLLFQWNRNIEEYLKPAFDSIRISLSLEERQKLKSSIVSWFMKNVEELRGRYDSYQHLVAEYESQLALSPLLCNLVDPKY